MQPGWVGRPCRSHRLSSVLTVPTRLFSQSPPLVVDAAENSTFCPIETFLNLSIMARRSKYSTCIASKLNNSHRNLVITFDKTGREAEKKLSLFDLAMPNDPIRDRDPEFLK
jgi:hypothetical protein